MVANQPIERPNSQDYLVNELRDLRRTIEEFTRSSKFPFSIGHGGVPDFTVLPSESGDGTADLSVYYGDGNPLLVTRTVAGKKVFAIRDTLVGGQQPTLFGTDPIAGYGLATPYTQYSMYPYDPPDLGHGSATFYPIWTGNAQHLNPAVQASILLKLVSTAPNTTMQARWHLYDLVTGYSTYAAVQSLTNVTAGTSYANSALQATTVPQSEIGKSLIVDLEARISVGAGTAYASPNYFVGSGKGLADSIGGW
ncbi:hypothetical protein ACFWMR_01840 [Amycolatopsis thailandensis]|uniref:hypothetical protein n=1 Tax=Amycolatopsis thailandensis TaxID=589330 RepID=UPI0036491ED1